MSRGECAHTQSARDPSRQSSFTLKLNNNLRPIHSHLVAALREQYASITTTHTQAVSGMVFHT